MKDKKENDGNYNVDCFYYNMWCICKCFIKSLRVDIKMIVLILAIIFVIIEIVVIVDGFKLIMRGYD